ncbi:hypothetical protein ES707_02286 [subsurface metagenome]
MAQTIERKRIIDIKKDFYYLDPLKNIPEIYWNQKIWLQVPSKQAPIRIETNKRLRDFLNERFILHQLRQLKLRPIPITESIEMTKREVWYYIEILAKRDNKPFDGNYKGFVKAIKLYCETIQEEVDVPYWGYVLDVLKIKSKARATIYEEDDKIEGLWKSVGLDKDTLENYTDAPFFLIYCEKEDTITAFLKELLRRGYNKEYFYCLNLGGEATTNAIRLLREYLNIKNFHCFVLHDIDLSGLEIFFDIRKHFNCKSIGVNPEFLEYSGYDFDELSEGYKSEASRKMVEKKTYTVFNELDISIEEREKYLSWIERCSEKRIELNSITAHKIESDPSVSKVNDFVDYFIHVLEETPWNLNNLRALKKSEKKTDYFGRWDEKTYVWNMKSKIPRVRVYPNLILEFDEENIVEDKINEEYKGYFDVITEISNVITTNTETIEEKLEDLTNTEKEVINNLIDEIKGEYPKIFEGINWREVLESKYPNKVKKLNNLIKMSEKGVRFRNIKKYVELTKQLKSYIGSIMEDIPEKIIRAKEKEFRTHILEYSGRPEAIKRKRKYDKGLQRNLRQTTEYKETKADMTKLGEELEERQKKEDKRLEFLENFKIRIGEVFTELIGDLNEFDNKTND